MKNFHRIAVTGAAVLVMGAMSVTAFAASAYSTPAEAAADLTGRTVDSVISERSTTGRNYGVIASDAGMGDQFRQEMLELRKTALEKRVEAGTLTREQADALIAQIEQNMADCDGTGDGACTGECIGLGAGTGLGLGSGTQARGTGSGLGMGVGQSRGMRGVGSGLGLHDGTCIAE